MSFKGEFPFRPFRELWPPVQQWPKRPAFHLDMARPYYMTPVLGYKVKQDMVVHAFKRII